MVTRKRTPSARLTSSLSLIMDLGYPQDVFLHQAVEGPSLDACAGEAETTSFLPQSDDHFATMGMFESDIGEISARPFPTKEQTSALEAHFSTNHKPNSLAKRQIAMETRLTLPRVVVSTFYMSKKCERR